MSTPRQYFNPIIQNRMPMTQNVLNLRRNSLFQPGKHLVIDGKECLNFASHNYLGFAGNERIEEAAIECVKKFGVGSCGPRAFYGTAGIFSGSEPFFQT